MSKQTWAYPAEVSHVSAARHAVGGYATANGVPEAEVRCLKQALTEAVTNAVLHGYCSTDSGTVTVTLAIEAGTASLRVTDDGQGLGEPTNRPGLGIGMLLMREMADRMTIGTPATGRGTEVCMAFDYPAAEADLAVAPAVAV